MIDYTQHPLIVLAHVLSDPENRTTKISTLCNAWGVEPVRLGSTSILMPDTIARLARYALAVWESEEQS